MRLPKNLLTNTMTKPRLFLCETNKDKICELETTSMNGSFKFNAYSDLNCTIPRTYTNMVTGKTDVNPHYDKIEALRLLLLEGFGYFEIQDPEIDTDGIKETKSILAYSLEYTLSQKYLENFKVNTGEIDSIEVMYAEKHKTAIESVIFFNAANHELSLVHLILEKIYGWKIGHVDDSLKLMGRTFDISRTSVYDFIVQDICDKFNCFAVFDTFENTINFYAEALVTKHIGDGTTTMFMISPAYDSLGSVSIDSYKTTAYQYVITEKNDIKIGVVTFNTPPANGARIEITDGSQEKWSTDVFVTFDNLAQNANVKYSADNIKTVLTVKGADDLDIREVNMGLPYIVDLSYYHSAEWMGKELCNAYTEYVQKSNKHRLQYAENAEQMLELSDRITYEKQRLSLEYSIAENVTSTTVGTYYVRGGEEGNYYYKEVQLPDEYNANVDKYYMLDGTDLNEVKFGDLYSALQTYFVSEDTKDVSAINELKDSFAFMETHVVDDKTYTIEDLSNDLSNANNVAEKDAAILYFFNRMWDQIGTVPLESLYYKPYKKIEATNSEAKWNEPSNENYWRYYPVTLVFKSIEDENEERDVIIQKYQDEHNTLQQDNNIIAEDISIYNNFTHDQLIRLSAFLREDEYTDDNFVVTEIDTIDKIMITKQELLECGKIELNKLCSPKLEFSMDMANIYALPEFEPIIGQFKLGNLINVAIRNDYVKRARLLQVDINFDDFSDFSCEFGELMNLRTPSSIHADLLANALSAGKSVASSASYWNKGSDAATSLSELIRQGLLDATTTIKSIDGTQGVSIDQYGIHLRKFDETTGELDAKEGWIINNQFLYSDDNFQTTKSVFGEYTVDGQAKWGLLAEAVMAGYIAGCTIEGGTINIGEGTFVVDQFGNVTMNAAAIAGYVEKNGVISSINQSPEQFAIDANRISLNGKTIDLTGDNIIIDSTNFSVTKDGNITAKSGEIAGWAITDDALRKEFTKNNTTHQMYLQAPNGDSTLNAFAVRKKNVNSSDWDVQFLVDYQGRMVAQNAYIVGTLHATAGSIAGYTIGPGGCFTNALYQRVTGADADYEVGFKATGGNADLAFYVKQSTDNWASSENVFYVNNNGKLYAQNADISGKITASNGTIGGWTIGESKIYGTSDTGHVAAVQLPTSDSLFVFAAGGTSHDSYASCPFRVTKDGKLYASKGYIGGFAIEDKSLRSEIQLYATKYQTFMQAADGTSTITAFAVRHSVDNGETWSYPFRVNYDGSAIMTNATITGSSKINAACIEDLHAEYITAGTISADRIPNISASKITSGTISTARLDSSVITTSNFSSKDLTTGNLTVTGGSKLGYWTVTTSGGLTCGSGSSSVGLSSSGVSHGSGWTASWYDIIQAGNSASDERLKTDISEFEDCYDKIFDNLRPVKFRYNIDEDRVRLGFIAQDVIENFETNGVHDFGGVYIGEGDDTYYRLLKEDFIAINTWQIQKLKNRIEELEKRLEALEA